MAETAAVRRAEETVRVVKYGSIVDQIDETFNTLTRQAYEIARASIGEMLRARPTSWRVESAR